MTTLDLDALERAARAKAELGFNSWAFNPNAILSLISDYRALQERVEEAETALRPFAEAGEDIDLTEDQQTNLWGHPTALNLELEHLGAARAYFAARTKAGEPHEQE